MADVTVERWPKAEARCKVVVRVEVIDADGTSSIRRYAGSVDNIRTFANAAGDEAGVVLHGTGLT